MLSATSPLHGPRIEGRNKITVNAAQIRTPEREQAVIMEEGMHGAGIMPSGEGLARRESRSRTGNMRAEYLKRKAHGLPTDPATIREEAAIAKLLKADVNAGVV